MRLAMPISFSKLHIQKLEGKFKNMVNTSYCVLVTHLFSSSYLISGSKNALQFENILSGNELGSWNGTAFVAPIDGIYVFNLKIVTYGYNRMYRMRALINNGEVGIDQLNENASRYQTNTYNGHTQSFQIEREMKVGDTLTIMDEYVYSTSYLNDYSEYKCSTNNQAHSCSHITGRLIKRL